eukprot:1921270-Pleurochrysis_carterae.AAC.5
MRPIGKCACASVTPGRAHVVGERKHRAKHRGAAAAARRRVLAVQPGHGDANILAVLTPCSTVPPLILLHVEGCAVEMVLQYDSAPAQAQR